MLIPFTKAYNEKKAQAFLEKCQAIATDLKAKDEAFLQAYRQKNLPALQDRLDLISDLNTPTKRFEELSKLARELEKSEIEFAKFDIKKLPSQKFLRDNPYSFAEPIGALILFPSMMGPFSAGFVIGNPLILLLAIPLVGICVGSMTMIEIAGNKKLKKMQEAGGIAAYTIDNPYTDLTKKVENEIKVILDTHLSDLVQSGLDEKYPAVKDAFLAKAKKELIADPERQAQVLPDAVLHAVRHQKL